MDFWKHGLIQEEINSIFYPKRQNVWSKRSVYTLKLLPKCTKLVTKCHAFQIHVFVENFETLDDGLWLCICVCVCVCVWGVSLQCRFASRSVQGVWSCLCLTHMKQTSWDAIDATLWTRDAASSSPTNRNLVHLLSRSSLTHPEVSLMVSSGFFCLSVCRFM